MTAQKLTKSSSTESFKTFKQALQQKAHSITKMELQERREAAMANQQAPDTKTNQTPNRREQPLCADGMAPRKEKEAVACVDEPAAAAAATTPHDRHSPAKVEPDPEVRHRSAFVGENGHGSKVNIAAEADVSVGLTLDTNTEADGGDGGAAIPISPPSSPAYVATKHEILTEAEKEQPAKALDTDAESNVPVQVATKVSEEEVRSPSGGGGPAPAAPAEVPSTPLPPTALSAAMEVAAASGEGSKSGQEPPAPAISATPTEEGLETLTVATAAGDRLPPPPVRLGRGRKLCPNCHALTKSAVKQCRDCHHVFSPASSRLRPPPRAEPKENEDVTITSRRRLRPSQRLMEYDCEAAGPSSPVSSGTVGAGSVAIRRPLAANAANGGVGGANLISAGGGGRPAAAGGAGGMTKKSVSAGAGGGGAKSAADSMPTPPKRSHKRKIPLPPGVAPPKRKKGAAAAGVAEREPEATRQADNLIRPFSNNGPDRTVVARNLLAPSTKLGSAIVPSGSSPSAPASAPGPLLFMPPSSSQEDEDTWLPAPSSYLSTGDQQALPQQGLSTLAAVGPASGSGSAPVAFSTNCVSQASWHNAGNGLSAPASSFVPSYGSSAVVAQQQKQLQQRFDGLDLSAASQDQDPFEGVELWLEDVQRPREQQQRTSGGGGAALPAVSLSASPTVSGGATAGLSAFPVGVSAGVGGDCITGSGAIEQRALSLEENMEFLGDGDMMWMSPLRTPSAESTGSTLWQESANTSSGSTISTTANSPAGALHSMVSRGSPAPDFERVAALASTTTADLLPRGFSNMSSMSPMGRTTSLDLHGLLGESSSGLEASLETVDVADGGCGGVGESAWNTVSRGFLCSNIRGGDGGTGRDAAQQHLDAFLGGSSNFSASPSVVGL